MFAWVWWRVESCRRNDNVTSDGRAIVVGVNSSRIIHRFIVRTCSLPCRLANHLSNAIAIGKAACLGQILACVGKADEEGTCVSL